MLITKKIEIDMGHCLENHKSKCRNIHGHRYIVEVGVDDKLINLSGDSSEGMVMDFGDLKSVMMEIIDERYDHGFVISESDFRTPYLRELWKNNKQKLTIVKFPPTAENLAGLWFKELKVVLDKKRIKLQYVKVWETPNSTATYTIENFIKEMTTIGPIFKKKICEECGADYLDREETFQCYECREKVTSILHEEKV